ncbi:MAG: hypothetical protein AB2A00_28915 [Myxococcota bacterium]
MARGTPGFVGWALLCAWACDPLASGQQPCQGLPTDPAECTTTDAPLHCSGERGRGGSGGDNVCTEQLELGYGCEERFTWQDSVDVIWVIDNSYSMLDENSGVQQNINTFAERVVSSGLDIRVVMVTQKGQGGGYYNTAICVPEPLAGPGCADSARFKHVDAEVQSTDGPDVLLRELPQFASFLRPGARKSIVFVTDDNAYMPATEFLNQLSPPSVLRGAVIHGVVGLSAQECPGIATVGTEYITMADETAGLLIPICCESYATLAEHLAREVSDGTGRFRLSRPPHGERVGVFFVDNVGRETEVATGWSYDAELQSVVFEQDSRPAPGTVMIIRYFVT